MDWYPYELWEYVSLLQHYAMTLFLTYLVIALCCWSIFRLKWTSRKIFLHRFLKLLFRIQTCIIINDNDNRGLVLFVVWKLDYNLLAIIALRIHSLLHFELFAEERYSHPSWLQAKHTILIGAIKYLYMTLRILRSTSWMKPRETLNPAYSMYHAMLSHEWENETWCKKFQWIIRVQSPTEIALHAKENVSFYPTKRDWKSFKRLIINFSLILLQVFLVCEHSILRYQIIWRLIGLKETNSNIALNIKISTSELESVNVITDSSSLKYCIVNWLFIVLSYALMT
jgi:hypothetical protein